MRILCISTYFLPYLSGLTVYPYRLFKHLTVKGHRVRVITFRHSHNLSLKEIIDGIEVERIGYWFKLSKGFFAPRFFASAFRQIKKADIVLLNEPIIEGLPAAIWARILGKKVIAIHNCQLDLGQDILSAGLSKIVNFLVFLQLFFCHKIVVSSEDYADASGLSLFKKKLIYIPPPAARHASDRGFGQKLKKLKEDYVWIGYAGRIAREKGLEYLIEAYALLKEKRSPVLVFAGPDANSVVGEGKYSEKIKRMLKEKKTPRHFLGRLSDGEMGAFYKTIDVLVLPSINRTEAFGLVQVEAMLQGTPVVVSDLPGVRLPVRLTGMGSLAKPQDAGDLARAIDRTLRDKTLVTDEKLARVFNLFHESQAGKQWLKLLKQVKL